MKRVVNEASAHKKGLRTCNNFIVCNLACAHPPAVPWHFGEGEPNKRKIPLLASSAFVVTLISMKEVKIANKVQQFLEGVVHELSQAMRCDNRIRIVFDFRSYLESLSAMKVVQQAS